MSWARTFHGREYFMGAHILEARIFWGMRRYFKMCAYILIGSQYFDMRRYFEGVRIHFGLKVSVLCVNYYFRQAPIFNDFCSKFCPVLFSQ